MIELRQQLEPILRETHEAIGHHEEELQKELQSEIPDSARVGNLVLLIHQLRLEIGDNRRAFLEAFADQLLPNQRRRLHQIHKIARLQRLLPSFEKVGLLP